MRDDSTGSALSRELLQLFFAQSSDALFVAVPDEARTTSTIVACNDAACRLYRMPHERLVGMDLTALAADHVKRVTSDAIQRVQKVGNVQLQTLHCRDDGIVLHVDLRLKYVPGTDRNVILVTIHDRTQRLDTERRLAVQHTISRVLAEANHFTDIASEMLQIIGELLSWEQGLLWLVDEHSNVMRCTQTWHAATIDNTFEVISKHITYGPGAGLPGKIWAIRNTVWVDDLRSFDHFTRYEGAADVGFRSAFGFPLLGQSGVFGVIEFYSRTERPPDAALQEMALTIGIQSGQFIERQRAETAVRAGDARKGAILRAALDAIITIDHQGCITEFNPAAERIFGHRSDDVVGHDMADLLIPLHLRPHHLQGIARHLTTGESHILGKRIEMTALRADGSEFPAELAITRIPTEGSPVFTAFVRDISIRKQAEQRVHFLGEASTLLAASLDYEVTLATLVDLAVPRLADWCSINLIDAKGMYSRVAAKHIDPDKEAVLLRIRQQYPPDSERSTLSGAPHLPEQSLLIRDLTPEHLARLAQHPDQLNTYLTMGFRSALLVPLRAGTRLLGMLILLTGESGRRFSSEDQRLAEDLAGRAALAIDNANLYRTAQDAIHLRDEFLSVAAHELKTPVTAMMGYTQILQRRASLQTNEKDRRAFDTLATQSERLSHLVETLLDVSRIQLGSFALDSKLLDLCDMAQRVVDEFRPLLLTSGQHTLKLDCPTQPLEVMGDATRIEQVLRNLVQNALKYSPDGGTITISLRRDEEYALISVQDQGMGIPAHVQEHLFQRFYRAPNIVDLNISGMGIGLYVVHEIVSRHDGQVEVQSAEGQGSTFSIRLPLAPAQPTIADHAEANGDS